MLNTGLGSSTHCVFEICFALLIFSWTDVEVFVVAVSIGYSLPLLFLHLLKVLFRAAWSSLHHHIRAFAHAAQVVGNA